MTQEHIDSLPALPGESTRMLDFSDESLRELVATRGWADLPVSERIGAVYDFVRNEIAFGYNTDDNIPASKVLADGYGQCNTKSTLLMALLRLVNIECRFHGATIHKRLQKGVVPSFLYWLAPTRILHSWVEVFVEDDWKRLEGVILDDQYIDGLRTYLSQDSGALVGYGVGTENLAQPPVEWKGCDTEIQMTGVNSDLGIYADPDAFYAAEGTNLSGLKAVFYRGVIRHLMNRKVTVIRARTHSRNDGTVRHQRCHR